MALATKSLARVLIPAMRASSRRSSPLWASTSTSPTRPRRPMEGAVKSTGTRQTMRSASTRTGSSANSRFPTCVARKAFTRRFAVAAPTLMSALRWISICKRPVRGRVNESVSTLMSHLKPYTHLNRKAVASIIAGSWTWSNLLNWRAAIGHAIMPRLPRNKSHQDGKR